MAAPVFPNSTAVGQHCKPYLLMTQTKKSEETKKRLADQKPKRFVETKANEGHPC